MNIRFLEPARTELDDAISWYEIEQENLGRLFLEDVSFALNGLQPFQKLCDNCTWVAALHNKKVPLYARLRH
jgi:hypothetical protein